MELVLVAVALLLFLLALVGKAGRGIGSLPVRSAPLMTKRERIVCDFLLEDRASGAIIAIVELDDRTHNARQDAERDRMTARAGYTTIRLPAGHQTALSVRETLLGTLPPHQPIPTASRRSAARV